MVPRSKPSGRNSSSDNSRKMSTMALPRPQTSNSLMVHTRWPAEDTPRRRLRASLHYGREGRRRRHRELLVHSPDRRRIEPPSAPLDHGDGDAFLHHLVFLVDQPPLPGDDPAPPARMGLLFQDLAGCPDAVTDEDRPAEVPRADFQEGERAHLRVGDDQPTADRQPEQAV